MNVIIIEYKRETIIEANLLIQQEQIHDNFKVHTSIQVLYLWAPLFMTSVDYF